MQRIMEKPIPESGRLVEVRQRRYVVLDVQRSALPVTLSPEGITSAHNLVSLSSVEDDALGEEIQVIWELEPSAVIFDKAELPQPDTFDAPDLLDAFLDSVRWGAISSADIRELQSPFRSGIEIEDYQLDPVVRALRMPRVNLLIADDVGLGKTIESGLVVEELMLRHRIRSVLVVCPSSLQIQWKVQMRDKFGLEFRIVDTELMRDLRRKRGLHVNPWNHFPRLITSIDFLKRDRPLRLFREILPAKGESTYPRKFDILIVDEAHNIAPSGGGNYATDSQRTSAIRTIAPHFEHKLFLTATPHNGYKESFSALLELLDNQRFARDVPPNPKQLEAVMVRRLKRELPLKWDGTPRFPKREIEPLQVEYSETEKRIHQLLREYTRLRQQDSADNTERYATDFVLKLLKKRLFSSPEAFRKTLERHAVSIRTAKRRTPLAERPSEGTLRKTFEEIESDFASDDEFDEKTEEAIDDATRLFRNLTPEESKVLSELRHLAEAEAKKPDSKAACLIRWLESTLRPNGQWNNERVLIFTEYRDTQNWLQGHLAARGLASHDRLKTLYGGMESDKREEVKAAFQADPADSPIRILLATDAASEGIDLQNHCYRLIHYEIPWNPNRMEQRNGRLDRHGQKAPEVFVYHFVGAGFDKKTQLAGTKPGDLDGDLEFLMRAVIKVDTIREDLGKVGPVIASQVEEAMLGKRRQLETGQAEEEAKAVKRIYSFERNIREQCEKHKEQLDESQRELNVYPENIQAVVSIALELAGQPPLTETKLKGVWPDPEGRRKSCPVFNMPALTGSWAFCAEGLDHPHTKRKRPITFDHDVAKDRDDVVLVHLNHRLVQMATRLLRAEIWSTGTRKKLNRVTARIVPSKALDSPAVIAFGRLVVLGGDNQRLHEEVISAGGSIKEGKFTRFRTVGEVKSALEAVEDSDVPKQMKSSFKELWPKIADPLLRALDARMKDRTENLQNKLNESQEKDITDITLRLEELKKAIEQELGRQPDVQLQLFSAPEREQLDRNRESLKERLLRIPIEIEREVEAIKKRYADPNPRLFPVAVMFLVPEKIAREAGGNR